MSAQGDMDAPGAMLREIHEQPARFARFLVDAADEVAETRAQIERAGPSCIMLAGRGTSGHAALYAKYLAEIQLGIPTSLVAPSVLTVYAARPNLERALFVAVSQSGGSPDLVDSTVAAGELGALTVAVTNAPGSPLAQAARLHVDVRAGAETAVAATKSYTSELLALYVLLTGRDASCVVEAAERTLAYDGDVERAAELLRDVRELVVLARGYSVASAREAALKLMETSYLPALAFSAAEFLHGPVAMLSPSSSVVALSTPGAGATAMQPVLDRLTGVGTHPLLVGPVGGLRVASAGIPDDLHPLIDILPLQRLAWQMATDRGVDPDHPRGLSKVTSTW